MKTEDEMIEEALVEVGLTHCKCGRKLDRGDIAWNNGQTEWGTELTYVEIICQACDEDVAHIQSWWPGIESIEELCDVIKTDYGK